MKKSRFPTNISLTGVVWSAATTFVDNTKRRTPFIAAGGHTETHRIRKSLHDLYVLCAIKKLKSSYTCGPDGLPAIFFKRLGSSLVVPVVFKQ